MSLYETVFIARQDVQASEAHRLADKFTEILSKYNAKVLKREYWGLRALAYEVKKNKKGHYIMLGIDASIEALAELERQYKINEDVIKYGVFKVDAIEEGPSYMMHAPAKAVPGAGLEDNIQSQF